MRVVGTAGHVDHGKSTLVNALTGINPDRLLEEQKREMTIELGFAWMTLPNGEQVGIVDVPGHRDFIENMLAGVGGIDAVIFVIAADEGIMPQTREHLAILDILKVKNGIVALTKSDLVEPDWLDMMKEEVHHFLRGTNLENAKIIPVSAKTGFGLDDLKHELTGLLKEIPDRRNIGHSRLPIDRVFTIAGFGTVVTGTLIDGSLRTGTEVEILPEAIKGRIRGLQTHKQKEETAFPGSRCAVNISGVDVNQIQRGDVLVEPGYFKPTTRFDATVEIIKDASEPLKHGEEIKVFSGAAETIGRVRLIGSDSIKPSEHGWVQIETANPLVLVQGDRFVIRKPSPGETLGGGVIDDPHPAKRHKRFDEAAINLFEMTDLGTEGERILSILDASGLMTIESLSQRSGLESKKLSNDVKKLSEEGRVLVFDQIDKEISVNLYLVSTEYWNAQKEELLKILSDFHSKNPLKMGLSMEEVKTRMGINQKQFAWLLENLQQSNAIGQSGSLIFRFDHQIELTPEQQRKVDELLKIFKENLLTPPSVKDSIEKVGVEVFGILKDRDELVQVSDDVVFSKDSMQLQRDAILKHFSGNPQITVAEYRDLVSTSRKFAMAFLEYCDSSGLTQRNGDYRILVKKDR